MMRGQRKARTASPQQRLVRSIVAGYVLALIVIASIPIGVHVLIDRTARVLSHSAAVINTAGHQRTVALRVALAAHRWSSQPDAAHAADLDEQIREMQDEHAMLFGENGDPAPMMTPKVHAAYFDGAAPLDRQVHDFIAHARALRAAPGDAAALAALDAAVQGPLRVALNDAVSMYQAEQEQVVARLVRNQGRAIWIVVLVLLIEALFVFRPLLMLVRRYRTGMQRAVAEDQLTGLLNRKALFERAPGWLDEHADAPASAVLFEIDGYDALAREVGESGADVLTKRVAGELAALPAASLIARLGAHSFVALVPLAAPSAAAIASRICEEIAGKLHRLGRQDIAVACSRGIAERRAGESLELLLSRADVSLDAARQGGADSAFAT